MQTLQLLRRRLGQNIVFSKEIIEWVVAHREQEKKVGEIQRLRDTELEIFPEACPEVYELMRPDQRVGTKFLKESKSPLIADDPGLGKTWQVIASIIEDGSVKGANLVVCPKISITSVWLTELNRLQSEVVFIAPEGRKAREEMFAEMKECAEMDVPFWLVVNWSMITLRDGKFQFDELKDIAWNNVIVDEAHLTGLSNSSSQTAQGMFQLNSGKRIAMTGTPMGGKPLRLWGILHWLDPQEFGNQYQWADRWVDSSMGYGSGGKTFKQYRGIPKHKEEEFARAHEKYILRRTKEEVRKAELERLGVETMSLPPHVIDIWVDMLPKQKKQYKEMEDKARISIEEQEEVTGQVNVTTMLATYAWLKQFATGYCDLQENGFKLNQVTGREEVRYKALPTDEASPKLDAIWQVCQELDIHEGGPEKLLIFSQFRGWTNLIHDWLKKKGVAVDKITGAVKTPDRNRIQEDFQNPEGSLRVICLTTQAAGVSINLDMADNVIFVDETWNPDDQTQALNRVHRASRMHTVTVRYLRTNGTIERDVLRTNERKKDINDILLDKYRRSQNG
jgi:SNF2 family DNA or RNA helicase